VDYAVHIIERCPDEQILIAVSQVNRGVGWQRAASDIGMSEDGLRLRAKRMNLAVRKGRAPVVRSSRLQMPTMPGDLGYLAGIIDGEGHICIEDGRHRSVLVGVTNTDQPLLAMLEQIGGSISWKKSHSNDGRFGTKPCATWQLRQRADVFHFLTSIEPYMHMKRDKARSAIAQLQIWMQIVVGS
jgi:hypothetical protein